MRNPVVISEQRFAHAVLPVEVERMVRDKFGSDSDTWRIYRSLASWATRSQAA
jgi:hypothetical protein